MLEVLEDVRRVHLYSKYRWVWLILIKWRNMPDLFQLLAQMADTCKFMTTIKAKQSYTTPSR